MEKKRNYYEILGVGKEVGEAELKAVYRKLALKYHPDRNRGNTESAEIKMQELNEAYGVLSNPEKRAEYDNAASPSNSRAAKKSSAGVNIDDIFGDTLSNFFRQSNININQEKMRGEPERTSNRAPVGNDKKSAGSGACKQCGGSGRERVTVKSGFGRVVQTQACSVCSGKV
jgi:molecular chaperone DnaJ